MEFPHCNIEVSHHNIEFPHRNIKFPHRKIGKRYLVLEMRKMFICNFTLPTSGSVSTCDSVSALSRLMQGSVLLKPQVCFCQRRHRITGQIARLSARTRKVRVSPLFDVRFCACIGKHT
jgi:hypothetical protein